MKHLTFSKPLLEEAAPATTPQKHRREARLQTILDEARLVLSRNGYADFTLRKVAAEAGVPLGTLQHYFPTRELLLTTVITQTIRTFNDRYEQISLGPDTAEQKLLAIVDLALREIEEPDTRAFFLEVTTVAVHEKFAAEALTESHRNYLGLLTRLVGEINSSLTRAESELRALLIAAQVEGFMMFGKEATASAQRDQEALRRAVKLVASSLCSAA